MLTAAHLARRTLPTALTCGVLALAVSACGTAAADNDAEPSTAAGAGLDIGVGTIHPTSGKKIAVMISSSTALSYGEAEGKAAQAEAAKLGYKADVFYADLNPATELATFQHVISSGDYAGLILHPVNNQLCVPLKTEALKHNLPVEIVDTALCDDGSGSGDDLWAPGTVSYLGGQSTRPGVEEVLAAAAKQLSGPQKVALVLGVQGHPATVAWQSAWKTFAASHPDWQLVDTVYTDFSTPSAFSATQNLLTAHSDITAIFDPYADIASGVVKAIQARGLTGKVALYENGGGNKAAVEMVKAGEMTGDLPAYPAQLLTTAVDNMVKALGGQQPPKFVGGDGNPNAESFGLLSKDNVGTFTADY